MLLRSLLGRLSIHLVVGFPLLLFPSNDLISLALLTNLLFFILFTCPFQSYQLSLINDVFHRLAFKILIPNVRNVLLLVVCSLVYATKHKTDLLFKFMLYFYWLLSRNEAFHKSGRLCSFINLFYLNIG